MRAIEEEARRRRRTTLVLARAAAIVRSGSTRVWVDARRRDTELRAKRRRGLDPSAFYYKLRREIRHDSGRVRARRRRHRGERGRRTVELTVANTGNRPIQIGSHFHSFEGESALGSTVPSRSVCAWNVPAAPLSASSRDEKRVTLVELARRPPVFGLNALTDGAGREQALARLACVGAASMSLRLSRRQYAISTALTTGDRVRLADTDLLIRIERDLTGPARRRKFGGGKVIRDGMGQSRARPGPTASSTW